MKNNQKKLVEKAIAFRKIGIRGNLAINILEKQLAVSMANDFVDLFNDYYYGSLGGFDFASFPYGVIEYTLDYRKEGLPHQYVILSSAGDEGTVFMETQDSREKPSPVIWCSLEDFYSLCAGEKFQYEYDEWPSFTDFFEFLIEDEKEFQKQMKD